LKIGIFGAGGFGREVHPEVQALHATSEIVFVVDVCSGEIPSINGVRVISLAEALAEGWDIILAVADWQARKRVMEEVRDSSSRILSMTARDAVIYSNNEILDGAVICSKSIITSNVKIGRGFQCNLFAYVAHDCVIGDYVTFAPRVSCNGNVIVEDGAYIGTGAIIRQGTKDSPLVIGQGAIVGMGAVVTKNVPPNCTVVGNPARVLIPNGP
jgi:sugar O-acyltransferase (sialic acid O-acetyltransferase NeuD family)